MLVSTPATAQTAQKLKGAPDGSLSSITQTAAPFKAATKGAIHKATQRQGMSVPSLRKAMQAAGMVEKTPFKAFGAAEQLPHLAGMVTYQEGWSNAYAPLGLYSLQNDGTMEQIVLGPTGMGGILVGDLYWTSTFNQSSSGIVIYNRAYDIETGEQKYSFTPTGAYEKIVIDFTTDPTTGTIYTLGYDSQANNMQLGTATFSATGGMTITKIAILSGNWNTISCDAEGQLYGISYVGEETDDDFTVTSSTLCKINKTTGAVTAIGETGHQPQYLSSSTIDPKTGKMYWTVNSPDDAGYLCEVNLTTGAATKLFNFALNDEVQGLYIQQVADENAPAAATNLSAAFSGSSLSGTISFEAPTTTYDGTTATGSLTYTVTANGETVATGTTQYGANVQAAVTVPAGGMYVFEVTTANAAGTSPVAKLSTYVGPATPAATTATLVYENGQMKLTWTAVTTAAGQGFFDPTAVSYTVTRYPDAVKVYEGPNTSYTETIAEPSSITQYYYTVVATAEGVSSAVAASNIVTLGSIVPPYSNTFDNDAMLDGFTIIDANNDGKKWTLTSGMMRITYNTSLAMDDWLITPPIKLEGGKLYKVSFDAKANSNTYMERVEAKWGTAPTAAAMTNNLVAPTDLGGTLMNLGDYVAPTADGVYYIGIHGISDKDKYYLYVDNLTISAPMVAAVPSGVTDLTVTPDADGEYKATVSFTAPTTDMDGGDLTELTKIEVTRGADLVKTFETPALGAALSFVDIATEGGLTTYSVTAYNNNGAGTTVSASAFLGVERPAAPANITITEEGNTGIVTLTWDPVTTDYNGNPINPSRVQYVVCEYSPFGWMPIIDPISATTYTLQADVEAGQQTFVQYAVYASTDGGENGNVSDMIAVGTPYEGIEESFADGQLSYVWATGYSAGEGAWTLYTDAQFSDITSCDGDNGFAGMKSGYVNGSCGLISGKITLEGAVNPGVSFYVYNIAGGDAPDTNEMQIYVKESSAAEWTAAGEAITMDGAAAGQNGWAQVTVSLADYAGKAIQVRFQATTKVFAYTMLDKIKIGSMLAHDLAVESVTAPETVACGTDYKVDVTVANKGTMQADGFSVELYADGELIATETVEALASGVSTTVSFNRSMSPIATEAVEYHAVVKYEADENMADNTSATIVVEPKVSKLPKVIDLKGESAADGVALTWSEPDLTATPVEEETTDFEDGTSWAQEYEGWTFVDKDASEVGGIQNMDIPGITPGTTKASFFIFDTTNEQVAGNTTFEAHSGNKYLASFFRYDDGQVDDWAISPELTGEAQTISFYAKSYSTQYPETIEMYYSTGSLETDDFVKVGTTVKPVPGSWTKYSFDVPAGAKHFAVRSLATGSFMLMMDDFTFIAAGNTTADLSIVGYDVYRDGVKITAEPTGETEYTDVTATDGDHTYVVVTVYTTGISAPSNSVLVAYTGIEDAMSEGIVITAGKGIITVSGAEGKMLTVAATDGKLLYSGMAGTTTNVPASAGVYVVKAGEKIVKVAVK